VIDAPVHFERTARSRRTVETIWPFAHTALHTAILETSRLLSGQEKSQDKNRVFAGAEAMPGILFPGRGVRHR
jgi:hypothetical protein